MDFVHLRTAVGSWVLIVAVVAGLRSSFHAESAADMMFRDLLLSLRDVGDEVDLGPLLRNASRVCLIPPYVLREDLERRIGAEIAEEVLDFTVWEDWWGLALKDPGGVRVVKGRRLDSDYDPKQRDFCSDDPPRLHMILVDADRRRVVRLSH